MRRPTLQRLLTVLAGAAALTSTGCGVVARGVDRATQEVLQIGHVGRSGKLTPKELDWAKTAWKYIDNNTVPATGLVNSVDKVPTTTVWQIGDYLAALVAANQLGLIDLLEFDRRVSKLLDFLNNMPLSNLSLPNRVYNTQNGLMVNFANQPADIGWSAIEIGRLLTWMKIAGQRYPHLREYFDKVVLRWNFCPVIDDCGVLFGAGSKEGRTSPAQEGRLGYLQYASAGFAAWGFETRKSAVTAPWEAIDVMGVKLQVDARDDRVTGEIAPVVTMPYVLLGIEFGWEYPRDPKLLGNRQESDTLQKLTEDIFRIQELRYQKQGILTARTDHPLQKPPFFVYDTVFASGYAWNTLSDQGRQVEGMSLVATKAVFGMWALARNAYTDRLLLSVEALHKNDKGWFEGRYEASGGYEDLLTLSTNAFVLQALLYKAQGRQYPKQSQIGYFGYTLGNQFARPQHCFPVERPVCKAPTTTDGRSFLR
ncbi:MAG: hypothetical protein RL260_1014 [Pseudomonadota bacterium]|jgi:Protein of unknown function (DUF3131)